MMPAYTAEEWKKVLLSQDNPNELRALFEWCMAEHHRSLT